MRYMLATCGICKDCPRQVIHLMSRTSGPVIALACSPKSDPFVMRVSRAPEGKETFNGEEEPEAAFAGAEVRKLRDADAMLNAGKDLSAVVQTLEVSEATYDRWRNQYGGMKAEEAVRLKKLEEENKRLKELVAEKELDIRMLKHIAEGNW